MSILNKRLARMEGAVPLPRITMAEIDARIDELLAKMGTTQDEVIALHGSLQGYGRHLRTDIVRESPTSICGGD